MFRTLVAPLLALLALGTSLADASAPNLDVPPTEGVWWSSEAPGTGVAFNIDAQNRWFAAIYLYDAEGRPTFLTMQGDAIEYVDVPNINGDDPLAAYARAVSPLIHSEGGQCLKCPWTQATASASGDGEARIEFYGRNRAELKVGDWTLRLAPLVDGSEFGAEFPELWDVERFDLSSDYFTVRIETETVDAVVLARLESSPNSLPLNPNVNFHLACIDCRVPDGDATATDEAQALLAGPMYLQAVTISCPRSAMPPLSNCRVGARFTDSAFVPSAYYVSQDSSEIIVLDHGDGEVREPGKMTLRAMPAGWTPDLP